VRTLVVALLLASATPVVAQPAAECPTSECAPLSAAADPAGAQLWRDVAGVHQLKIAFVEGLQRFVRAQAGTFGDEGEELRASLAAMQEALTRWDAAIETFRTRASRVAGADASIALATVLLDRHRLDEALRALAAAEQLDDGRADLYAMRALASAASGRHDQAVRALRRATALDSRDPTTAYALVEQLTRLGRLDDAEEARRGLQRSLTSPRQVRFARVDLLTQRPGAAPIFAQARYASGFDALDAGDYATALSRFAAAVPNDPLLTGPADDRARIAEAIAALRAGRIDAALKLLQSVAAASPESSEIHRALGVVYHVDRQSNRSIEHLRTAIRLSPSDERARVMLADVLVEDRRLAEAERELQLAIEAGLRSGQVVYRLAQLYQRQSVLPRAAQAFADSEAFGPIVGRDYFYQAWAGLLVNQADFDGAVAVYRKRVDVNANSAEAHRQLGEIYFLQGRHEEALTEFQVAVWLDPKDAKAHAAAGQSYVRLSKWPEAISALQRALALDGSLREARYALGTVLMRTDRTEDARREFDLFARQQAEAEDAGRREFQLDALRRQAAKEALAGNHEQAVIHYQEVASMDDGPRAQRDLGIALLRAQRASEAVEPLARAQAAEETADGYAHLINALAASGRAEEAAQQRSLYRQHLLRLRMERVKELGGL